MTEKFKVIPSILVFEKPDKYYERNHTFYFDNQFVVCVCFLKKNWHVLQTDKILHGTGH